MNRPAPEDYSPAEFEEELETDVVAENIIREQIIQNQLVNTIPKSSERHQNDLKISPKERLIKQDGMGDSSLDKVQIYNDSYDEGHTKRFVSLPEPIHKRQRIPNS